MENVKSRAVMSMHPTAETCTAYDAIMIPGGGIDRNHRLPLWVKRRLDRALEIHRDGYIITLSAGTVHKPLPLDRYGYPIFESAAAAEYLIKKGANPQQILCETCSYDTIGNAYFSRVIHVEPRTFGKLLVITSRFHMPRTRTIFEWIYGLPSPLTVKSVELDFEEVPDEGIDEDILRARVEREKTSLQNVLRLKKELRTLLDFHRWLFTEHGAYSTSTPPIRIKGGALEMY